MDDNGELTGGPALIQARARELPDAPGIYKMLDEHGEALYVGKARSLRRRVASYARIQTMPVRLQRMVAAVRGIDIIRTHTEAEALLLESNLIKKLKPRYNVLLRDDKSFPYILLTDDHEFPLLTKHRGPRNRAGDYFGPFASAGAVNETIDTLQKAFMIRNCSDNVFAGRTRPCLQYQIKRCTAPCVGFVSAADYARQIDDARAFLGGHSRTVQDRLAAEMSAASAREDYETAARLRDRIRALTAVQSRQDINLEGLGDADIFGLHRDGGRICIQVFFFRAGQNFGNRAYFPRHAEDDSDAAVMAAFMAQFYDNKPVPPLILTAPAPAERALLEEAFTARREGRAIRIRTPQRGAHKRLADFVIRNAREALIQNAATAADTGMALKALADLCGLPEPPRRIEVYDNSHTGGTRMTGAMIVAGPDGFVKSAYRKFNIVDSGTSDDYAMMREVIRRRCARLQTKDDGDRPVWPDLMLIDGGKGQLSSVREVLDDLQLSDRIPVLSIAKGPDRNAGRETFFMHGRQSFTLPPDDPVLHYLQRLRDEAHRFAIGAHRARRGKAIGQSPLDDVPGIGAARRRALLRHFGSGADVARAGLSDLEAVPGISKATARRIYEHFHGVAE